MLLPLFFNKSAMEKQPIWRTELLCTVPHWRGAKDLVSSLFQLLHLLHTRAGRWWINLKTEISDLPLPPAALENITHGQTAFFKAGVETNQRRANKKKNWDRSRCRTRKHLWGTQKKRQRSERCIAINTGINITFNLNMRDTREIYFEMGSQL